MAALGLDLAALPQRLCDRSHSFLPAPVWKGDTRAKFAALNADAVKSCTGSVWPPQVITVARALALVRARGWSGIPCRVPKLLVLWLSLSWVANVWLHVTEAKNYPRALL